jgi:hypothetical protein
MFETGRGFKSFRLALLANDPVLLRTLSFGPEGRTEFPNFTGDAPAKSRKEDSLVLLGTFSFNPDPRFPNSVVLVFTADPLALACMSPKCPPYCNVIIPPDLLWNPWGPTRVNRPEKTNKKKKGVDIGNQRMCLRGV